jgi:hypothetical protein
VATKRRDSESTETSIRAVFDSNIYVAAYLSKNPRSPNKELFQRWRFLYVIRGDTKPT